MIVLTQHTPMIIRRNEALRIADNINLPTSRRLQAEEEALLLSEEIMTRARRSVDAEVKLIPPSVVSEIVSVSRDKIKKITSKVVCVGCGITRTYYQHDIDKNPQRYESWRCMKCRTE